MKHFKTVIQKVIETTQVSCSFLSLIASVSFTNCNSNNNQINNNQINNNQINNNNN
ncbi:hypothetical protein [Fluviispira multicolorata]|uniref:hypothetical protein n=1 Tax=Fluviispira multicolorata TaxID=2654512 RepID=UPI0013754AE4|nr:hypothetical protein [Fluviispira multicolorata]